MYGQIVGPILRGLGMKFVEKTLEEIAESMYDTAKNYGRRAWAWVTGEVDTNPDINGNAGYTGLVSLTSKHEANEALAAVTLAGSSDPIHLTVSGRELSALFPTYDQEQWDVIDGRTMRFLFELNRTLLDEENHVIRLLFFLAWQQQFTATNVFILPSEDPDLRRSKEVGTKVHTDEWRLEVLEGFVSTLLDSSLASRNWRAIMESAISGDGDTVWTYVWSFFKKATQPMTFRNTTHRARANIAWDSIKVNAPWLYDAVESCMSSNLLFDSARIWKNFPMASSTGPDTEVLDAYKFFTCNYITKIT